MKIKRLEKVYEGKAKILYATEDPALMIQYFKDDASAFDGVKKGTIVDKGVINNEVSNRIYKHLEEKGIKTHFVEAELDVLREYGYRINSLMITFFKERNIRLVDFKLEFGRYKGEILLGDEISPDGCRLWHSETGEKMDKDRFRFSMGSVEEKYREVYNLVCSDKN